jgi:ornithine carbamoyltransferase
MSPAPSKQSAPPAIGEATRELVDRARRLRASLDVDAVPPLRGRHVAIASEGHDSPSARLFERAASLLGAHVSRIGPDALALEPHRQEAAARILGSLYDAIDFIPLPPERAESLQSVAGVPVFADLGGERSPLLALLSAPADPAEREAELLALVQAVLVQAMGAV